MNSAEKDQTLNSLQKKYEELEQDYNTKAAELEKAQKQIPTSKTIMQLVKATREANRNATASAAIVPINTTTVARSGLSNNTNFSNIQSSTVQSSVGLKSSSVNNSSVSKTVNNALSTPQRQDKENIQQIR